MGLIGGLGGGVGLIGGLGGGVGLIGGVGKTGRRGSDWRTGQRRGSEAWIDGLGLGPVTLRSMEGHGLGDGAWGDWRWGLAWVGELGRWNRSAVRELADELRNEGDEGEIGRAHV